VLLPVFGLIAVALCGLTVLGIATARVGVLGVMVGVAAALIPVGIVVAAFLWIDRWEPEPGKLLLSAFIWGSCVAAITALLINNTAEVVGDFLIGKGKGSNFSAVVSAPLVEEAAKGLFVLLVLWRLSTEFDGVIDGVVYAGFSAAGFAFTETIYYFGRAFVEHGFGTATGAGVVSVFVLRGILSPFTHPLFTVFTGIGIGIAARTTNRKLTVLAPLGGYLAAVLLHALWNGATTFGGAPMFVNFYFLIMVPVFIGVFFLVLRHRRNEQRTVASSLPAMVSDHLIARSEVALLSSLPARRRWRRKAAKQFGRRASRAVAEYQLSVTELAFFRRNMAKGVAGERAEERHDELVMAVKNSRAEAVRIADNGMVVGNAPAKTVTKTLGKTEPSADRVHRVEPTGVEEAE
jgi:RsiW-degrading membrane proteinase PrsW (M82 family)